MVTFRNIINFGTYSSRIYAPLIRCNPSLRLNTTMAGAKSSPGTGKLIIRGMAIGALAGAGYAGFVSFQENQVNNQMATPQKPIVLDVAPEFKITRKIVSSTDDSGLELVLFQYQTCPFCCKVRAYLDYAGFSYSVVEVDAVLRQSIKWSLYKKVPILLVKTRNGKYVQLNDSTMIISTLASYMLDKHQDFISLVKCYPSMTFTGDDGKPKSDIMNKYFIMMQEQEINDKKEISANERKWRIWADDHLVHLISPNVYRTRAEALETFEWFANIGEWRENFPYWECQLMIYVGAFAMYMISGRLKKRHNLTDDVRGHLYDACNLVTDVLKMHKKPFIGGKSPNLADLAIFGVLRSMEGCQAFKECLANTNIGTWFYAVKTLSDKNRGIIEKS